MFLRTTDCSGAFGLKSVHFHFHFCQLWPKKAKGLKMLACAKNKSDTQHYLNRPLSQMVTVLEVSS